MSPVICQTIDVHNLLYLGKLQELICEMNEGMNAIASNSVDALKESIAKQESLCASLAESNVVEDARLKRLRQSAHAPTESAIDRTIWDASNTIRKLNLQYAALLKHSGKTIELLSALCLSYTGMSDESYDPWSKQQTWSCEI